MAEAAVATEQQRVNGVSLQDLTQTVEAITAEPGLAKYRFHITNQWIDAGHNRSTITDAIGPDGELVPHKQPFVLDADEPEALLSGDEGANPVEALLHALAGCITTGFVYHAAAKGVQLEEVRSELEGDIDLRGFLGLAEDVRNGFQNIRIKISAKADVSEERLKALANLGRERSPVYDMVTNTVPVDFEVEAL
jgi:uncharacterized OsmC-like protein